MIASLAKQDALGIATLAILAGHCRYAHMAALKCARVNPEGLGMSRVRSDLIRINPGGPVIPCTPDM